SLRREGQGGGAAAQDRLAPAAAAAGRREGRGTVRQGEGRAGQARQDLGAAALRVLPDPARRQGSDRARGEGRPQGRLRIARGAGPEARIVARVTQAAFGETYWLQAGAFSEEKEADNLK